MKTNGDFFKGLSKEDKIKFREQYGRHPLRDFIDWQEFYNSENGNELDFVKCIEKTKMVIDNMFDEEVQEEKDVIILLEFIDDDTEYQLVYVIDDDTFYKIPKPTPVTLIPEELDGEPDEEILDDDIEDNF